MALKDYLDTSKTIRTKIVAIYNNLLKEYKDGNIKSQTDFNYKFKNQIRDYLKSLNEKTFKFYPAVSTPDSAEYNLMISSAINDINNNFDKLLNLKKYIDDSTDGTSINIDVLQGSAQLCNKVISDLSDSVINFAYSNASNIVESFADGATDNLQCNISTNEKILTLPITSAFVNNKDFNAEIYDSNGFPGNTHLVEEEQNGIIFDGEKAINGDIKAITDSSINTWFEYEIFNIDDDTYNACNGAGFSYKEGLSWITDGNELILKLRLTNLKTNKKFNWFSIVPYLPADKSYVPAILERVTIIGEESTNDMKINKFMNDTMIVTFEEQDVKYVDITIRQTNPYQAKIGHIYSLKAENHNLNVFDNVADKVYNRTDDFKPTVANLGITYNPETQQTEYNNSTNKYDETSAQSDFFVLPNNNSAIKYGKECLLAQRYAIGIKNIALSQYVFQDSGEFYSKDYEFKDEIKSITLYAESSVPNNFDQSQQWIKYYIAFSNEDVWHEIYPTNMAYKGACTIEINSELTETERKLNTRICYLDRLLDSKNFQVKVVLKKPEGTQYSSPIVYNYRLNVETGDDTFCL